MASTKTTAGNMTAAGAQYHIAADANGGAIKLIQPPGAKFVRLGSTANFVDLTQANVTDLLTALTGFSNTGQLT